MRIERVDGGKIKVVVDSNDVKVWNVDLKNFTDNTPEAQDMFWFALKQAQTNLNFNVGKAQLLVETVPDGEDGYVLYISRMEDEKELSEALIRAGKRAHPAQMKARPSGRPGTLLRIFKFGSFEELCLGAKEVREMFSGKSRVVKYMGEYCLELLPDDSFYLFRIDNILTEFGSRVKNPTAFQGILAEHGVVMIENDALETINQHF